MDIKKVINGSVVDISLTDFNIDLSDGLEEAILNSLYTDARSDGQKGWFGDAYNTYSIGSKLWTLRNAKQTNETLVLAKIYATDSLKWLVTEEIVDKIEVTTSWVDNGVLGLYVELYKNNENKIFKFEGDL